jgi:GAF domain-containing protein
VTVREPAVEEPQRLGLDRIAVAAAALLDVPLVSLSIIDRPGHVSVGASDPTQLCRQVASSGRPILVQDATRRRPAPNRRDCGFEVVAYAGVPVMIGNGTCVGTLPRSPRCGGPAGARSGRAPKLRRSGRRADRTCSGAGRSTP